MRPSVVLATWSRGRRPLAVRLDDAALSQGEDASCRQRPVAFAEAFDDIIPQRV